MKILVINGHPDKESYCQAIFQTIVETIDSNRHELEVISLNEEDFDPVLRYGYRKRMEVRLSKTDGRRFLYPSFSRMDPVGGSPDLCLSHLVE